MSDGSKQFSGQTLLFDADDTLWENYIYFEQSIAEFIAFLDHATHSPEQVRDVLNVCEAENIRAMGYGLRSFESSLMDCFARLMAVPADAAQRAAIANFAHGIATQPVVLLEGVRETLEMLAKRHALVLVTKGHEVEQRDKLRRSGLAEFFPQVEVLAEKDAGAYAELVERHGWERANCWMIGNSPKSDIASALGAGLHAVHVPHEQTWVLEQVEIVEPVGPQRLVRLRRFVELARIF